MDKQKTQVMYYVHVIIGLFFMFGFGKIPAIEPVTQVGMQVGGIFIGVIYLWSTVGGIWPSILGIIALGMSDYCNVATAIKEGMGNTTVWQVLFVMLLAGAINSSGCGELIARWIVTRKFVAGKPMVFTIVYLFTFFISAAFISNIAMIILGWSILYKIAEQLGYQKGDKYITMMIVGVHIAGICGGAAFPFRGVKLSLIDSFNKISDAPINYMVYLFVGLLVGTLFIIIYALAMKYIFKADFSKIYNLDLEQIKNENNRKFTVQEKSYLIAFGIAVVMILITTLFSAGPLVAFFNKISTTNVFALMVVLLSILRVNGESLLDIKTVAKSVNWNVIFICASAIPIANALTNEATGVSILFENLLTPMFGGQNPIIFIIILAIAVMVLTNCASNVGMGLLMMPIAIPIANSLGVSLEAVGLLIVMGVNYAFCTPGASPVAAMLFGNDWILSKKELYKYISFNFIVLLILVVAILYPLSAALM